MKETWKDIKGYEGLYQISNYGRVKSLDHYITNINGAKQLIKERIMKNGNTGNYQYVVLRKDNKSHNYYIHRLVAETFLNNPNNYTDVNHIDENKNNNRVDNLEWCNHKYNMNYGTIKEKIAKTLGIPIIQYSLTGDKIKEWGSAAAAAKALGISRSNISKSCRNKDSYCTAGGCFWRYITDDFIMPKHKNKRRVKQLDKEDNIINIYNSITEASINTNISKSDIGLCCRKKLKYAGGFKWEYIYE